MCRWGGIYQYDPNDVNILFFCLFLLSWDFIYLFFTLVYVFSINIIIVLFHHINCNLPNVGITKYPMATDADAMAKLGEMDGSSRLFTEELRDVASIPSYPPFSCGYGKGRLARARPGISPTPRDGQSLGQICRSDPLFTPVQPGTLPPSSSNSALPGPEALSPGLWSASGPAAHCVKGPAAPCHTAHLPGRRSECGIRWSGTRKEQKPWAF